VPNVVPTAAELARMSWHQRQQAIAALRRQVAALVRADSAGWDAYQLRTIQAQLVKLERDLGRPP
jgi:hypothetical protein